ncbi:MAG: translation initiation factor IF-6 [Thermoplasmata archaeon]|jgi:translation initiation factor 6|nr:translation initiation factor IF-6 [Thermoplasmatales archaeon]PMP75253.1 MAG: translation initiation factor IF-6 [Aciduliprofundum sp.]
MLLKGRLHNSPYVGVFSVCNESMAIIPKDSTPDEEKLVKRALDVDVHKTFIGGSPLLGSLMVMNSKGAVVADFGELEDLHFMKDDYNILFINDKINAVGNDILASDRVALVHPDFENETIRYIGEALDVEVVKGMIGGIKTVGSVAVVTKNALLVNPQVDEKEIKFLQDLFRLPVHLTTANFGSIYIGASMIANSKGALVGDLSTPIEVFEIEDAIASK